MSHSFETPWTIGCQAPLTMEFPRQEYWSELLFPSPGDLPNPGNEPTSPALTAGFFTTGPLGKPLLSINQFKKKRHCWVTKSRWCLVLNWPVIVYVIVCSSHAMSRKKDISEKQGYTVFIFYTHKDTEMPVTIFVYSILQKQPKCAASLLAFLLQRLLFHVNNNKNQEPLYENNYTVQDKWLIQKISWQVMTWNLSTNVWFYILCMATNVY